MSNKQPPSDSTGPMGMQPIDRGRTTPTLTLPMMPGSKGEAKAPAPQKQEKQRTRAEAVRVALARKTRRNSLRKQRDAQKS